MNQLLLLGIIFLIPAIFIILRNFLWDLSFWQKKNYSIERFSLNILWDLDKDSFSHTVIGLKFIIFAFIALGFESYFAGLVGILAILILWSYEAIQRLAITFSTREPNIDLFKPRNLISLLTFLTIIVFIFLAITLPFLTTGLVNESTIKTVTSSQNIPSVYVYLILISSSFLILDLLTSLVVSILQIGINLIGIIRREAKFIIYSKKLSELREENHIVLYIGDNFNEIRLLLQSIRNEFVFIDMNNRHQAAEYIIDHGIKNHTIIVNLTEKNFHEDIKSLQPESIVFDSEELNVYKLSLLIPLKTNIIINHDYLNIESNKIGEIHAGQKTFFSRNEVKGKFEDSNFNFITSFSENEKQLNIELNLSGQSENIALKSSNLRFLNALLPAILISKINNNKIRDLLKNLENNFIDNKELFIPGDNSTKIVNFSNVELSYIDLRRNILLANEHKGEGKLILLTNGINRKKIPAKFFRDILNKVDIVITNDFNFLKELKKYSFKTFYADNFRSFAYLARRHSKKGDIFLIEGHYKEHIIQILKAN